MTKITKATLKSFIKKNIGELYTRTIMDIDLHDDGIRNVKDVFKKSEKASEYEKYNLGIKGIHLVGYGSGNYFRPYKDEHFEGIRIDNCCGAYVVAVERQ